MFSNQIPWQFRVDPRSNSNLAQPSPLNSFEPDPAEKKEAFRILVIDNLPPMRTHMINLLRMHFRQTIETIPAATKSEALAVVAAKSPDLVILDVVIGKCNGFALAENIRQVKPNTKLLFWSQSIRTKHMRELERFKNEGAAYGYISKEEADEKIIYALESILLHDNIYIQPLCRSAKLQGKQDLAYLSEAEFQTLCDVAIGLTDRAIAMRRHLSVRGVQNRINALQLKILRNECGIVNGTFGIELLNQRSRLVFEALSLGLIDVDEIQEWSNDYFDALNEQMESTA